MATAHRFCRAGVSEVPSVVGVDVHACLVGVVLSPGGQYRNGPGAPLDARPSPGPRAVGCVVGVPAGLGEEGGGVDDEATFRFPIL